MTLDIDIIDPEGNELKESKEIYFNYIRNSFGFCQFVLVNTNIDIREYPFFTPEEDYKAIYPPEIRKKEMLQKVEEIKEKIKIREDLYLKFTEDSWMNNTEYHRILKDTYSTDDGSIMALIPKNKSEKFEFRWLNHEFYLNWVYTFDKLINLLSKEGNGFHISS